MRAFESIDNHRLIYNGLQHIEFELCRQQASYFRIAREAHQILYRSLVDALKGTANIAVTGKPKGRREHRYQYGVEPIKEIQKESVAGCNFAWRFSIPVVVDSFFQSNTAEATTDSDDFLIPFYDALAMIQTECFVHQYVHSQEVTFTDEEMKLMEWLHEYIRNKYEHFVPKGYSAPIQSLLLVSKVALNKARQSLFHTQNVHFIDHPISQKLMQDKFVAILKIIESHLDVGDKATENRE
jgi:hypothetical protein